MQQLFFGIALVLAGPIGGFYMYKKFNSTAMEMQYMQTTPIADAIDLVSSMHQADPNYRHFVELKGVIQSDQPITAPYSGLQVAHYSNHCYSVHEETVTSRDKNGHTHTRMVKKENKIASETSPMPAFIKDSSSDTPIYIDLDSFGKDVDLQPGCDRFEPQNSPWLQQHQSCVNHWGSPPRARLLGYRLTEKILAANQSVYALGEMYLSNGKFFIGKSYTGKKRSVFTYKSEDQLVSGAKNKKLISLAGGLLCLIIGVVAIATWF